MRRRVVTHNKWVGQSSRRYGTNLRKLVKRLGMPKVLVIQEAQNLERDDVPDGYRMVRCQNEKLTFDDTYKAIVFLVRKDVEVLAVVWKRVPNGGWVWKSGRKAARVWGRLVCRDERPGGIFEVWGGHRIPGGPNPKIDQNEKAWDAEHRFIRRWVVKVRQRHPMRQITLAADWNARWSEEGATSLKRLASEIGALGEVVGIDGFLIIRGGDPRPQAKKLRGRYGADTHRPVFVDL